MSEHEATPEEIERALEVTVHALAVGADVPPHLLLGFVDVISSEILAEHIHHGCTRCIVCDAPIERVDPPE